MRFGSSRVEPDAQELQLQRAVSRQFLLQPVISMVVPVYRVALPVLKAMVESVRTQTTRAGSFAWPTASRKIGRREPGCGLMAQDDRRIKIELLTENLGISGNSNRALALATGEYRGAARS